MADLNTVAAESPIVNRPLVGVVGGGTMGAGIAEAVARAGCQVTVSDAQPDAARTRLEKSLQRAVRANKLSTGDADAALGRVAVVDNLDALASADIVIEAVPEDPVLKESIFKRLDEVARPNALLASNTSSIPLIRLASATTRPERVIGIHFFNPVPVLPLVELVRTITTSDETVARAQVFAEQTLGKTVIQAKDRAGFIVNALLIPYLLAAVRMFEAGFASAEDIDQGMVAGCAHPIGPLALCDLIGLDTTAAVAESLFEEFREPLYAPPPMLQRMVSANLLGRKSGRGFYDYAKAAD